MTWEFFAANASFDQKTGAGVFAHWSNARKLRSDGERGLRQQAWNQMIALTGTRSSRGVLDAQWVMFDYARGCDAVRAACGVMDEFRLPKVSSHFFPSQRDAGEDGSGRWTGGPVVSIARVNCRDSHRARGHDRAVGAGRDVRPARTMGSGPVRTLTHVVVPAALPVIASGMKQGRAFSGRSLRAAETHVTILTGFAPGLLRYTVAGRVGYGRPY